MFKFEINSIAEKGKKKSQKFFLFDYRLLLNIAATVFLHRILKEITEKVKLIVHNASGTAGTDTPRVIEPRSVAFWSCLQKKKAGKSEKKKGENLNTPLFGIGG